MSLARAGGVMRRIIMGLAALGLSAGIAVAEPARKNVMLLIADDMGVTAGCYGDVAAKTPHIDELAKAGTRFTHAFACVSSWSPSRATLCTALPTHQNGQSRLAHPTHD